MNTCLHRGRTRRGGWRGAFFVRVGRLGVRTLALVALVAGFVAAGIASNAPAAEATGACDGVIVVVDFTDVGGVPEVRCSQLAEGTGRDFLLFAGFSTEDSPPGFLCAVNGQPNPCPETFEGSFWAYWHATADGEWTSYQVGADASHPVAGDIEGWRYNDGTTPPGIAPAEVTGALPTPSPSPSATGSDQQFTTPNDVEAQRTNQDLTLLIATAGFLAAVAAAVFTFVVRRRRKGNSPSGPVADDSEVRD